jgi:hypothetical protein
MFFRVVRHFSEIYFFKYNNKEARKLNSMLIIFMIISGRTGTTLHHIFFIRKTKNNQLLVK